MLKISTFRNKSEKRKDSVKNFIEALARLLAHSQSGRVIAYLLAIADDEIRGKWTPERDCFIMSEQLFPNSLYNSYWTIIEVMDQQSPDVNLVLDIQVTEDIVNALLVNFTMITHLKALNRERIGLAGVDASADFRGHLGIRKFPEIAKQLENINPCQRYLYRLSQRSTPSETTRKKRKPKATTTSASTDGESQDIFCSSIIGQKFLSLI